MNFVEKLRTSRTWQIIFLVKLGVLATVWALWDDGFMIGDKASVAAEKVSEKMPETGAKSEVASGAAGNTKSDVDSAKTAVKTRKSFLANLLELPDLHPEAIQKEELGKYLEIAERKKAQVEDRLEMLKKREEQLKGLETSIDDKLKRLDEERRYFSQTIQQEKQLKSERVDKLVAMYAKMEPKKAAPIMEKLDKDLVVELFKQIPQKQTTVILESMAADKSVMISEYYGRVRSTREYDVLKEMNNSLRKEFEDCKGLPSAGAPVAPPAPSAASTSP